MFKYPGHEITSEIYTHFTINEKTGEVTEFFGWTNSGVDSLRQALIGGLEIIREKIRPKHEAALKHLKRKRSYVWNTKANLEAHILADKEWDKIETKMAKIELLIWQLQSYNNSIDSLLSISREWIDVNLIDRESEYEMDSPLIVWNTKANKFYKVEDDFSISTWRVGTSGYKNKVVRGDVCGVSLFYLVCNLETDETYHQVTYNAETGNFERNRSTYYNGEYIPSSEVYYANIEDAIAGAKKGIDALIRKNRATVMAASEKS